MSNLFKDITSTLKETFKGKKGMPENSTQNAPEISLNSKQNASEFAQKYLGSVDSGGIAE